MTLEQWLEDGYTASEHTRPRRFLLARCVAAFAWGMLQAALDQRRRR